MKKIQRNVPPKQKISPATLENTREPVEYTDAVVEDYNDRYSTVFKIDPAKAKLVSVRQDSFKPWLAHVQLGEDIFDEDGEFQTTKKYSTIIQRQEFNKGTIRVTRTKDEDAYVTWKKVEKAAGLQDNELEALLGLGHNAVEAVYKVAKNSLNWYGEVRVRFDYEEVTP